MPNNDNSSSSNRSEIVNFEMLVAALNAASESVADAANKTISNVDNKSNETQEPVAKVEQPRMFGHYVIGKKLGQGGYGIVCIATDMAMGRDVALKLPNPHTMQHPDSKKRFVREAELAAQLDHPNIVSVYNFGEINQIVYIASALVEGQTLRDWLAEKKNIDFATTARIIAQIADGVAHAHDRGILHRDIKPGNILLSSAKDSNNLLPKLTDFGLARSIEFDDDISQTGQVIGTATYMSPEQAAGKRRDVGVRSDVWSLGAVLYEMLVGHPPFLGESQAEIRLKVIQEEIVPPSKIRKDIPADLEAVCLKCLEKDPNLRYGSASELAADLRHWLAGEPTTARPPGRLRQAYLMIRKYPFAATFGAMSLLAMLTSIGALLYHQAVLNAAYEKLRIKNDEQRLQIYQNDFQNINSLITNGQRGLLIDLLTKHRPIDREAEIRGWEWYYLWGLTHTKSTTLGEHQGMVNKVKFHADGKTLLSLGGDGVVKVFDTSTDTMISEWKVHESEANDVAWSPDGKTIAVSSDGGEVALLDWPSGRLQKTLKTKLGKIFELMFIRTEPFLIACTENRPIVWDLNTGEHKIIAGEWYDEPRSLEVCSTDFANQRVLIGVNLEAISVFQVKINTRLKGIDRIWMMCDFGVNRPVEESGYKFRAVEPLPNGVCLVSYDEVGIGLYHTGRERIRIPEKNVRSLAISSDGKIVIASTDNGKLVHVTLSPQSIGPELLVDDKRFNSLAVGKDDRTIAAASRDGRVLLYRNLQPSLRYEMRNSVNRGIPQLVPEKKWIVIHHSNNHEQKLTVWDYSEQRKIAELSLEELLRQPGIDKRKTAHLAMHPSGDRIMVSHLNSATLQEYSLPDFKPIRSFGRNVPNNARERGSYSPDGRWFACGNDSELELWDLSKTPECHVVSGTRNTVPIVAFHPRSSHLVWRSADREIRILNLMSMTEEAGIQSPEIQDTSRLAFSPDGSRLVSSVDHRNLTVWSWQTRSVMHSIVNDDREVELSFTPDGKRLVAAGGRHVRFIDLATGKFVWELPSQFPEDLHWRNALFDPIDSTMLIVGTNRDGDGGLYMFPIAQNDRE